MRSASAVPASKGLWSVDALELWGFEDSLSITVESIFSAGPPQRTWPVSVRKGAVKLWCRDQRFEF